MCLVHYTESLISSLNMDQSYCILLHLDVFGTLAAKDFVLSWFLNYFIVWTIINP